MIRIPLRTISQLCWLAAFANSVSAATSCVVVTPAPAQVIVGGAVTPIEPRLPTRFADCDTLKVLSGKVSVCYTVGGGQRTCSELGPGATFPVTANAAGKDVTDSFRATLLAFAKGDAQTKYGQTRAKTPKVPGMPYGEVLVVGDALEISLKTSGLKDPFVMQVERSDVRGSPVAVQAGDGLVRIAASDLVAGARYQWRVKGTDKDLTGSFRVGERADVTRLSPRIAALRNDAALSNEGRAVLLAELFIENGYAYNAYVELARVDVISRE